MTGDPVDVSAIDEKKLDVIVGEEVHVLDLFRHFIFFGEEIIKSCEADCLRLVDVASSLRLVVMAALLDDEEVLFQTPFKHTAMLSVESATKVRLLGRRLGNCSLGSAMVFDFKRLFFQNKLRLT